MADDLRIHSKPNQRPILRPTPPIARPLEPQAKAATRPLRPQGSLGKTSQLDLASFGTETFRGLADPLPSLSRITAALDTASAPDHAKQARPMVEGILDPATFVHAAYREALGRTPTPDELQAELGRAKDANARHALLEKLVASPEFASRNLRVDAAFQAGTPTAVTVPGTNKTLHVLWPYPAGSRHGGPERLSSPGDMNRFRDYMAPFAHYFGAGTRGSQMMWTADQVAKGRLYPGSEATKQLGQIAQSLFWDVPMLQNSDEALRKSGISPDLNDPKHMVAYLQGQKDRIEGLMAKQDPAYDGPVHRQSAQELHGMVDAALSRARAFVAGDRSRIETAPTGGFGVYNTAQTVSGQAPAMFVRDDPRAAVEAADARIRQNPDLLGPDSFYQRAKGALLGS